MEGLLLIALTVIVVLQVVTGLLVVALLRKPMNITIYIEDSDARPMPEEGEEWKG